MDQMNDVAAVRVLFRYVVELIFESCEVRVLDLEPFLDGPVLEALVDGYQVFRQAQVDAEAGTLVWPTDVRSAGYPRSRTTSLTTVANRCSS